MKKIKQIILVLYSLIRFQFNHFYYKGLQIKGYSLVSPRAKLELGKKAKTWISSGVKV